jgi:hypothetical protein
VAEAEQHPELWQTVQYSETACIQYIYSATQAQCSDFLLGRGMARATPDPSPLVDSPQQKCLRDHYTSSCSPYQHKSLAARFTGSERKTPHLP